MASYGQRFGTFPRRSQRQNPGEGTAREAGKEGGQKLGIRNVPRLCAGTVRAQQGTGVWPPAGSGWMVSLLLTFRSGASGSIQGPWDRADGSPSVAVVNGQVE